MRRFVLGWKVLGYESRLRARIVNYADDFVICCRGSGQEAAQAMRAMMQKLKLTVNEAKTRQCRVPDDSFDFLGYTLGRCWSAKARLCRITVLHVCVLSLIQWLTIVLSTIDQRKDFFNVPIQCAKNIVRYRGGFATSGRVD